MPRVGPASSCPSTPAPQRFSGSTGPSPPQRQTGLLGTSAQSAATQMPLVRLLSLAGDPCLPPSFPSHPDPLKSLPRPASRASQPQPNSGLIFSPRPCPSLFQGWPSLPTTALLTALPPNRLPVKIDTSCTASAAHTGVLVPSTTSSGPAAHWDDARDRHELTRARQVQGSAQVPGGQARRPLVE